MSMVEKMTSLLRGGRRRAEPVGAVHVVDPSPLNWLHITYNTVEELVRVSTQGKIRPAAMRRYRWANDRTLDVRVREGERFPDGEPLTASSVKRSFEEVMRWAAPHPPGTQFNLDPRTRCELTGEHTVRFHLPAPDGLALGKLRAMHIMSTRFWEKIGFGYERNGTGEGHWWVIDAPGPWGTGPFVLAEGHSSLDTERATISREPFACTWLWHEDRTPTVRLVANTNYWDKRRGPHLGEVVFRNDLSPKEALELVCTTEGEVDILTEVSPADAERVERSEHAHLVSIDAMRAVVGVINRDAEGLPLKDRRARQALNLAVDRDSLVREAMFGRARPLAGLTPPTAITLLHRFPNRLTPYPHDADRAAELWREAGGGLGRGRPLRIAAPDEFERMARGIAADLREALGIDTEVTVYRGEEKLQARRRLAEKVLPHEWDVLLLEQVTQTADAPPLELHRAFAGATGEYRAGPVIPEFEALYAQFVRQTSQVRLAQVTNSIDRFVYDEALALFLCAPQALYAVNKHVDFTAYRTTFELPECRVSDEHWSRR